MTNIPTDALIGIGTGEGARLFRNKGDVQNIKLELTDTLEPGDLANEGPSGKSPPEQSPQESMEATFFKLLAQHLTQSRMARRPTILFWCWTPIRWARCAHCCIRKSRIV